MLPHATELERLEKTVREAMHDGGSAQVYTLLDEIDGPLRTVISLLRARVDSRLRQIELTDPDLEQAPAAYRAAVAEYFERLSRDYARPGEGKEP